MLKSIKSTPQDTKTQLNFRAESIIGLLKGLTNTVQQKYTIVGKVDSKI